MRLKDYKGFHIEKSTQYIGYKKEKAIYYEVYKGKERFMAYVSLKDAKKGIDGYLNGTNREEYDRIRKQMQELNESVHK